MSNIDAGTRPETRKSAPVWRIRLLAVVAAAAGAALVQVIAAAAGAAMEAPGPDGAAAPIGVVNALVAGLIAGGLGWGARALLDRFAPRKAVAVWLIGASVIFLVQVFPPLFIEATPGTKIALLLMHVVVAAALFPVLAKRRDTVEA